MYTPIGFDLGGSTPQGLAQGYGIALFGEPQGVIVSDNTIAGHALADVALIDGENHLVRGNRLGTHSGGDHGSSVGIQIFSPSHVAIGGSEAGQGNVIVRQATAGIAVQGGVDYVSESGFYAGTWASNVAFDSDDAYSYEHDMYFGFAGDASNFSYDIGYLYYNYDSIAETDFGEVYGTIGFGDFSISASILANAEADEPAGLDFGFGEAYYLSLDYSVPLRNELSLGLHIGQHSGDFTEWFNGVPEDYMDYSISLSKGGFSFTISDTDLDDEQADGLDNGSLKFVVGYAFDFDL